MINFEEELKKFHPSLEVGDVQDTIYHQDLTDAVDLLLGLMKEPGLVADEFVEEPFE